MITIRVEYTVTYDGHEPIETTICLDIKSHSVHKMKDLDILALEFLEELIDGEIEINQVIIIDTP